jgi:hypothetical protein
VDLLSRKAGGWTSGEGGKGFLAVMPEARLDRR